MINSVAASHAKGKFATDKIFGAAAKAHAAIAKYGSDNVVNATLGSILNDDEKLVCLPIVEKVFKELPTVEIANYAPIAGMPDYLEAAINLVFGSYRPEAYIKAVSTTGGSGVIHHTIWNYTEIGDTLLTSDWFWSPYGVMCKDALRKLDNFELFDANYNFNINSFSNKISALLAKQTNLVIILNTPAHNPTGYTITNGEWDQIIAILKDKAKNQDKNIILLIDAAYIDFAGEKDESRSFLQKFSSLPENILTILAYSMSKSFTLYGQRTGAMIGVSSSKEIIEEFADINQFTNRATWSNNTRAGQKLLSVIYNDKTLLAQFIAEQAEYYRLIQARADIFTQEAKEANLLMLPYAAGFFISIPSSDSDTVCDKLHEDNIFAVPLKMGVRIAACAVPAKKMKGVAAKVAKAMK